MFQSTCLRRVPTVILAVFMIFGVFASQIEKASAHSSLDQFTVEADGYFRYLTHPKLGQTFRPTLNKLDGLGVYSGIQPAGPSSCTLSVVLYKNTDMSTPIAHRSTTIYKMESYTIIDIPPVNMVPNARYTMYATASSPYAYWLAKMSDVYPRGTAIIDSVADSGVDFVFATFGYNDTPPPQPDPIPSVDVSPNIDGGDAAPDASSAQASTDTTSTSTSTSSTSIAVPSGLTATAVSEGTAGLINLTWTASKTTDLTGYRIYRSVEETKGFTEIGTTDKKTMTFVDDKAVANQLYFYIVRAYKDTSESKNSNVASVTLTDKVAPAVPTNFKIISSSESEIVFTWDKNTDTDLANYILTVAENMDTDAKILAEIDTIGKDEDSYTLKLADNDDLVKDATYTFYLQAKDINTNFSEKAVTEGMFATEKKESNTWLWVIIGAGIVILAGAIVALILIRRKKKAKAIA